jgi:hypothetical protein
MSFITKEKLTNYEKNKLAHKIIKIRAKKE